MRATEFAARRAAALLTMEETAQLLGVSLKSVWRWENGRSAINQFIAATIRVRLVPGLGAKQSTSRDTLSNAAPEKGQRMDRLPNLRSPRE
jgi:transcriptional regulator with XRE-family HTH domain